MARNGDRQKEHEEQNGAGAVPQLLSSVMRKDLLLPAAVSVAGAAVAAKAPDALRKLTSATEEKGEGEAERLGERAAAGAKEGLAHDRGGLLRHLLPGGGDGPGGSGSGGEKTRRLTIQRWTDVSVPVATAYEAWTRFEDFPKFMHRVLSVERKGRNRVGWHEKIWFSSRQWEGEITEQRKNDRIVWKTTNGTSHRGIVSFHRLDDRLTRVMVTMEFEPRGLIEKLASGLRFVKRAVQADLARFKTFVEMEDAKGIEYRSSSSPGRAGDGKRAGRGGSRDAERRGREQRRQERRQRTGSR